MNQNNTKKEDRKPKEKFLKSRLTVLSNLYRSYVLDSKDKKRIELEHQDIENLLKTDRRTTKRICRDISDFSKLVGLYERGIQVDKSTFFRRNLDKEHKVKERIAESLCALLSDISVSSIAFGPGSTVAINADILGEEKKIPKTIVTNNLGVYDVLNRYQTSDLILTGGEYKPDIHAFVGRGAVDGFRNACCEVSVMGLSAINKEGELLVKYYDETDALKQMLLSTSERVFVVTSIHKFVSRDTFPVIRIQELLNEIPNVEVSIVTNPISELQNTNKEHQAKEVADALMKIGGGERVKIIWAD